MTMSARPTDALDLLIKDHRTVKKLFSDFEGLSDRSKATKSTVAKQICDALTIHTRVEEEIFYPAVRKAIKDDDLMDEALVEHAGAKELIAQIKTMDPSDDLYDAKIKVLSEQIEHHVEEEEGDMFPQVRKAEMDLGALGQEMSRRKEELEASGAASNAAASRATQQRSIAR